jgi:hypothetical protein
MARHQTTVFFWAVVPNCLTGKSPGVTGHGGTARPGHLVRMTVDIRGVATIPASDIPSISPIDPNVDNTHDLPDVTDPGVPACTWDIGQNEPAILASVAGLT